MALRQAQGDIAQGDTLGNKCKSDNQMYKIA